MLPAVPSLGVPVAARHAPPPPPPPPARHRTSVGERGGLPRLRPPVGVEELVERRRAARLEQHELGAEDEGGGGGGAAAAAAGHAAAGHAAAGEPGAAGAGCERLVLPHLMLPARGEVATRGEEMRSAVEQARASGDPTYRVFWGRA